MEREATDGGMGEEGGREGGSEGGSEAGRSERGMGDEGEAGNNNIIIININNNNETRSDRSSATREDSPSTGPAPSTPTYRRSSTWPAT